MQLVDFAVSDDNDCQGLFDPHAEFVTVHRSVLKSAVAARPGDFSRMVSASSTVSAGAESAFSSNMNDLDEDTTRSALPQTARCRDVKPATGNSLYAGLRLTRPSDCCAPRYHGAARVLAACNRIVGSQAEARWYWIKCFLSARLLSMELVVVW